MILLTYEILEFARCGMLDYLSKLTDNTIWVTTQNSTPDYWEVVTYGTTPSMIGHIRLNYIMDDCQALIDVYMEQI